MKYICYKKILDLELVYCLENRGYLIVRFQKASIHIYLANTELYTGNWLINKLRLQEIRYGLAVISNLCCNKTLGYLWYGLHGTNKPSLKN